MVLARIATEPDCLAIRACVVMLTTGNKGTHPTLPKGGPVGAFEFYSRKQPLQKGPPLQGKNLRPAPGAAGTVPTETGREPTPLEPLPTPRRSGTDLDCGQQW